MFLQPLPTIMIEPTVRAALLEDLGRAGDLTTDAIVPADLVASRSTLTGEHLAAFVGSRAKAAASR